MDAVGIDRLEQVQPGSELDSGAPRVFVVYVVRSLPLPIGRFWLCEAYELKLSEMQPI